MARNKSGGFNKLLNFIGLVDDEDTQDTYGEEYSSDNYGRRAAYTPARQQRTSSAGSRSTPARTSGTQRRLPENNARSSRYDSRAPRRYDDYRTGERRTASRFDDSSYASAPRAPRQSRYSEQPDPRYSDRNLPQRVSPQRGVCPPRQHPQGVGPDLSGRADVGGGQRHLRPGPQILTSRGFEWR